MARHILITGGTRGGIGFEAARILLNKGHHVVLTFRDEAKADDAVNALRRDLGLHRDRVSWVKMDLASFASVRAAGKEILELHQPLDALLLNAAVYDTSSAGPKATSDGWDTTYQVNHLSHFLLVHLLLPALLASKAPGGARIVAVSSELHRRGMGSLPASPTVLHDLLSPKQQQQQQQQAVSGAQAYALSKLYNLWFCYQLSSMLKAGGLPVTMDAVTPGWVPRTNLGSSGLSWWARLAMRHVLSLLPITTSLPEGARRVADVVDGTCVLAGTEQAAGGGAGAQEVVFGSGRYFSRAQAVPSSEASYDKACQQQLWQLSLKATGIEEKEYLPRGKP